jgi:hypothetical protein
MSIHKLHDALTSCESLISSLTVTPKDHHDEIKANYDRLVQEHESLKEKYEDHAAKCELHNAALEIATDSNVKLRNKIDNLEGEKFDIKEDLETIHKNAETMTAFVEKIKKKYDSLKKGKAALEEELKSSERIIDEQRERILELENECILAEYGAPHYDFIGKSNMIYDGVKVFSNETSEVMYIMQNVNKNFSYVTVGIFAISPEGELYKHNKVIDAIEAKISKPLCIARCSSLAQINEYIFRLTGITKFSSLSYFVDQENMLTPETNKDREFRCVLFLNWNDINDIKDFKKINEYKYVFGAAVEHSCNYMNKCIFDELHRYRSNNNLLSINTFNVEWQ